MYPLCSSDMKKTFKIDPHVHTAEVSLCGHLSAEDVAHRYHKLDYDGIVITDHLHEEYISSLGCRDNWHSCVKHFLQGYENAKAAGAHIGLKVILGAELRFLINDNDYLLYGINEDFLYNTPYLHRLDHKEFFTRFGNEILIIQAHPFRHDNEILAEYLHGVEVFNGNPRHDNRNERAVKLCKENPNMYPFYGSDAHQNGDEGRGYMLFNEAVANAHQFRNAVLKRNYQGF